jgi:hypothetical protein
MVLAYYVCSLSESKFVLLNFKKLLQNASFYRESVFPPGPARKIMIKNILENLSSFSSCFFPTTVTSHNLEQQKGQKNAN